MEKGVKLATKISCGFGMLLIVTIVLGIFVAVKCASITKLSVGVADFAVPQAELFSKMESDFTNAMLNYRLFIATADKNFEKTAKSYLKNVDKWIYSGRSLAKEKNSSNAKKLEKSVNDISSMLENYRSKAKKAAIAHKGLIEARNQLNLAGIEFTRLCNQLYAYLGNVLSESIRKRGDEFEARVKANIDNAIKILTKGSLLQILVLQSQIRNDPEMLLKALDDLEEINVLLKNILTRSDDSKTDDIVKEIQKTVANYRDAFDRLRNNWTLAKKVEAKQIKLGDNILRLAESNAIFGFQNARSKANFAVSELEHVHNLVIIGTVIAVIVGIILALIITAHISRPIRRATSELSDASFQLEMASQEVSSSSQSLAEVASQQAAALEEISSSLEEMSSMTKQNADNAKRADSYMKEAHRVVDEANRMMETLTSYMNEISETSKETFKIVKTIDEIAFQTNLLALNAAVEAARAGEAGAGFAVVADEVRALALRTAEAAKNTATLIEETVGKIRQGTQLTSTTHDSFSKVVNAINKVADLMGEINAASNEQAEGIEQINKALSEMDKAIQQTAANAEESAAASEELNAQAAQMKNMVAELVNLVGTSSGHAKQVSATETVKGAIESPSEDGSLKKLPSSFDEDHSF